MFFLLYYLCLLIPAYSACTAIYWALMLRANPRVCAPASKLGNDFKALRAFEDLIFKWNTSSRGRLEEPSVLLCHRRVKPRGFYRKSLLVCFHTEDFLRVLIAGTTREHQHPLWNLVGLELTWPAVLWSGIFGFTGGKNKELWLNVHSVMGKKSFDNSDWMWRSGQSEHE